MDLLIYNQLDASRVKAQFDRVVALLREGNFRGADVKKMQNTGFYRAKLNDADRLLFKIGEYQGRKVILLLEIILNHAYDHARFLRGRLVDESQFVPLENCEQLSDDHAEPLVYVNQKESRFHVLDRIISFDDHQLDAFSQRLPLILIGSAGSGKTVLVMEKLKESKGNVLYVTRSPHLADHARRLYYSLDYANEDQTITFSSFHEFLEMIRIPEGKPINYKAFSAWYTRHRQQYPFRNPHMLFEEFGGVLTGCSTEKPCLSRDEYLELGIRRSIFEKTERPRVYDLFEKYIASLNENGFYDPNMLACEYRIHCTPTYDFIAIDEIQDLTNTQIALLLMALRNDSNFILCGDSNQIVHPNFFSWANLKSMFYQKKTERPAEIFRILNQNYRNAPQVVDVANQLLRIKVARFGSVDRESNYLVRCVSSRQGDVELLPDQAAGNRSLNEKTQRSTRYAVLVLREEDKPAARKYFQTPLVFSIQEAKGLEYEHIILYNMVSGCRKEFEEITRSIRPEDLPGELDYARAKDKADKSLEIYKFYINALYVGLTRAISRIFWIESDTGHRLFQLLDLAVRQKAGQVTSETSTDEEWREEANRLEKKGNLEQAEQIRKQVLKQQEVPWTVWTPANLPELKKEALNPAHFNKKAKQQLFEYAITYGDTETLRQLADLNFTRAKTETDSTPVDLDYGRDLFGKEFKALREKTRLYGVDYRNPINQTPLMVAARIGKMEVIEWLVQEGASISAADSANLPVFWQIMAQWNQKQPRIFTDFDLIRLCECLAPPCIDIQFDQRLIKLDLHQFDYWMFFILLMHHAQYSRVPVRDEFGRYYREHLMTSQRLADLAELFPDVVMPTFRKRRNYCSASLSRNEFQGKAPYNRKIVYRFRTGFYFINPLLKVLINDRWIPVYEMLSGEFATYLKECVECWQTTGNLNPAWKR